MKMQPNSVRITVGPASERWIERQECTDLEKLVYYKLDQSILGIQCPPPVILDFAKDLIFAIDSYRLGVRDGQES